MWPSPEVDVALGPDYARVVYLLELGCEEGLGPVLESPSLPEGAELPKLCLFGLGDAVGFGGAAVDAVDLLEYPVDRVLGENGRGLGPRGMVAHDELVRADVNAHLLQCSPEGEGPAPQDGETLVLAVDARVYPGPLEAERRDCGENGVLEAREGFVHSQPPRDISRPRLRPSSAKASMRAGSTLAPGA